MEIKTKEAKWRQTCRDAKALCREGDGKERRRRKIRSRGLKDVE